MAQGRKNEAVLFQPKPCIQSCRRHVRCTCSCADLFQYSEFHMFSFRHKSYFWQDWDLLRVMCSRQDPSEFFIDRYSHGGDFVTGLFSVFFPLRYSLLWFSKDVM